MKTIERIFDATTGETKDIERDMTPEEVAHHQMRVAEIEAEILAKAEAEAKRQALLSKLGITEDEARLLLGGN